ncbi:MAG TPA: glutamine amidotransferase [Armatimonadota bacterium]|jgi:hypothetical protein
MKQALMLTMVLLCAWPALPGRAEVSLTEVPAAGQTHLQMKNEFFSLEIWPELGAQARSFLTRYSDREWCFPGDNAGHGALLRDCFVGTGYPNNELVMLPRTYEVAQDTPQRAVVKFRGTLPSGLVINKQVTMEADSPVLGVDFGMNNATGASVSKGLWAKSDIYVSGLRPDNHYFRPEVRGVNVSGWDEKLGQMQGEDFIRSPYEGWSAAINTGTKEGLVWLMDYNWLKWLYNCNTAWTAEWFYDTVTLPPGQAWTTHYDMILVQGFASVCHASENFIAGMSLSPAPTFAATKGPAPVILTHTLSRSKLGALQGARLTGRLREVDTGVVHDLEPVEVGDLTWEPKTVRQTVTVDPDIRVVAEVTLTATGPAGQAISEPYQYYWPGVSGEKFNLLAGAAVTTYYRAAPPKTKVYPKPANLTYYRKPEVKMLDFRGSYHEVWKVPEAATRAGVQDIRGSYFRTEPSFGSALSYLPEGFEQWFDYDLIVLNNVDAESLTDFGREALRDFVRAGGSLLVLGGFYAYGGGGYAGTQLEEVLPVEMNPKIARLQPLPNGKLRVSGTARALAGRRLSAAPTCFWWQEGKAKPGAWVELMAGEKPFLVCGTYGQGRVAAALGNVCGKSQPGRLAFWEDPEWVPTLGKVVRWLVFGEEKQSK